MKMLKHCQMNPLLKQIGTLGEIFILFMEKLELPVPHSFLHSEHQKASFGPGLVV